MSDKPTTQLGYVFVAIVGIRSGWRLLWRGNFGWYWGGRMETHAGDGDVVSLEGSRVLGESGTMDGGHYRR